MISHNAICNTISYLIDFAKMESKQAQEVIELKKKLALFDEEINKLARKGIGKEKQQELANFIASLGALHHLVFNNMINYERRAKAWDLLTETRQKNEKAEVLQNSEMVNDAINLIKSLTFDIQYVEKDIETVNNYKDQCKQKLKGITGNRPLNFLKAIATIAVTAIDAVVGATLGAIVGLIAPPIIGPIIGDKTTSKDASGIARVSNIMTCFWVGILSMPLISFTGLVVGAFTGGFLGHETGKDWTHTTEHESLGRQLLFKQSILSKRTQDIAKKASKLIDPKHTFFKASAKPAKPAEEKPTFAPTKIFSTP